VNPVIAVGLGVMFAGERITVIGITAMLIIITSIGMVIFGQKRF
jgi:drug/metabolite transporter (DMT)-like permease